MTKPDFVYVTYIKTTPEKVWQAITDPDVARQYWRTIPDGPHGARVNRSDWKVGSTWEHQRARDTSQVDVVGKVLDSDPPRKLVLSWARPAEAKDDSRHSRVTFDIESQGDRLVRLTVTHEDLEKDPSMFKGISGGWPMVLSNLKSLLETGKAL